MYDFPFLEVILATIGGAGIWKFLDTIVVRYWNRGQHHENLSADERENLREDIEFLRKQIAELRKEVDDLKRALDEKDEQVNGWQRAFWHSKGVLDKLVLQLKHYHSDVWDQVKAHVEEVEPHGK